MWLSLSIAASERLKRWLKPPPQVTAYFSMARSPGVVFRVSTMRAFVPFAPSTSLLVAVATPERWHSRLRAVRSHLRMDAVLPFTVAMMSPFVARSPSDLSLVICMEGSTSSNTLRAMSMPAITPVSLDTKSAQDMLSGAMSRSVARSI